MAAKAEKLQFQAETKQLLDLMIHSLYSNKEIFLRELISNASDAIDRLRFESLTNQDLLEDNAAFEIRLETNESERTLTIHDNGIGMTRDEVIRNIGTIAHSGSRELITKLKEAKGKGLPPELIGQFGVGFYSSFMVADKVSLVTRKAGDKAGTYWESQGDGTFTVTEAERATRGTSVTLHLKPESKEDGLDDFMSEWVLGRIVKQYSDFINYPIMLKVTREKVEEDATGHPIKDGKRIVEVEDRTLNSMKAIWSRPQSEVKAEDYNEFYRHISHDWKEPLRVITQRTEGGVSYDALLFLPQEAPFDLYYHAFRGGLQLYVKKVKIIEECEDLLPRWLRFVRGVVDSPDLPLNVSRELLQHNRQIHQIKRNLTKKVLDVLGDMLQKEPGKYLEFYQQYGKALKEGAATDFDTREKIMPLLWYESSRHPSERTTLTEYVKRMKEDQTDIFYLTGESRAVVENSPHLESFREKGYEVLFFTDNVDELFAQQVTTFEGKRFKSIGKGKVELGSKEEKEQAAKEQEEKQKQFASLFEYMQKRLDEYVKDVRLTNRLVSSPVCLVVAEHDYSPHMERLLQKGKGGGPKQRRIMELNPKHPLVEKMFARFESNKEDPTLGEYAELLFAQGLLAEGSGAEIPDPVTFGKRLAELMAKSL